MTFSHSIPRWAAPGLILLVTFLLASCSRPGSDTTASTSLELSATSFNRLPGWRQDAAAEALEPLRRSCEVIQRRDAQAYVGQTRMAGQVRDWRSACSALNRVGDSDSAARAYFQQHFRPWAVRGEGRFTGYYELAAPASTQRGGDFIAPLYGLPDEGTRSQSRADIDRGGLSGKGLEIAYLTNTVDRFFLHIQGSGVLTLPDGRQLRVSYAGNNGHSYRSIRDAMVAHGYNPQTHGARAQDWRAWLLANPDVAGGIMAHNPRYIYFRTHTEPGPIGAQGVPLTAGRSMAVDRSHIALGVPLWLDTTYTEPNGGRSQLRRLVIAQDTGAAITGPIRGDFYWGTGDWALARAGGMNDAGTYFLLLPRGVNPRD